MLAKNTIRVWGGLTTAFCITIFFMLTDAAFAAGRVAFGVGVTPGVGAADA